MLGVLVNQQAGQRNQARGVKLALFVEFVELPQRLVDVAAGQQHFSQCRPGLGRAGISFQGAAERIDLLIDAPQPAIAGPDRQISQFPQIDSFRGEYVPATPLEALTGRQPVSLGHLDVAFRYSISGLYRNSSACVAW